MNLDKFKKLLSLLRSGHEDRVKFSDLGINVYDVHLFDCLEQVCYILLEDVFSNEGTDWIMWYLYDKPKLDSTKSHATDADGNEIPLNTDEELWNFLKKEGYVRKY